MPILKRELELSPQSIFTLSETDFPWWVAQTRSRQDKALARYLEPLDVPFYLPCRERRTRRVGRTFVSYIPLFPGYVFFRGSAGHRQIALRSHLIVQVLDVRDQDLLTRELLQIRRLQEAGGDLVPCHELLPGDPVKITTGPFRSYTGIVLRNRGRLRLVVSISILKQAVAVEFERDVVAPIRREQPTREENRSAAVS